jgi:hypothetical protein
VLQIGGCRAFVGAVVPHTVSVMRHVGTHDSDTSSTQWQVALNGGGCPTVLRFTSSRGCEALRELHTGARVVEKGQAAEQLGSRAVAYLRLAPVIQ